MKAFSGKRFPTSQSIKFIHRRIIQIIIFEFFGFKDSNFGLYASCLIMMSKKIIYETYVIFHMKKLRNKLRITI